MSLHDIHLAALFPLAPSVSLKVSTEQIYRYKK